MRIMKQLPQDQISNYGLLDFNLHVTQKGCCRNSIGTYKRYQKLNQDNIDDFLMTLATNQDIIGCNNSYIEEVTSHVLAKNLQYLVKREQFAKALKTIYIYKHREGFRLKGENVMSYQLYASKVKLQTINSDSDSNIIIPKQQIAIVKIEAPSKEKIELQQTPPLLKKRYIQQTLGVFNQGLSPINSTNLLLQENQLKKRKLNSFQFKQENNDDEEEDIFPDMKVKQQNQFTEDEEEEFNPKGMRGQIQPVVQDKIFHEDDDEEEEEEDQQGGNPNTEYVTKPNNTFILNNKDLILKKFDFLSQENSTQSTNNKTNSQFLDQTFLSSQQQTGLYYNQNSINKTFLLNISNYEHQMNDKLKRACQTYYKLKEKPSGMHLIYISVFTLTDDDDVPNNEWARFKPYMVNAIQQKFSFDNPENYYYCKIGYTKNIERVDVHFKNYNAKFYKAYYCYKEREEQQFHTSQDALKFKVPINYPFAYEGKGEIYVFHPLLEWALNQRFRKIKQEQMKNYTH